MTNNHTDGKGVDRLLERIPVSMKMIDCASGDTLLTHMLLNQIQIMSMLIEIREKLG